MCVYYFTDVSLLLCLNHTLWTFRHEVTSEKMLISGSERDTCLAILKDMAYSSDEAMYNLNMERLEAVGCSPVLDYIRSTWHDIRSEWVEGLKEQHLTFGETTVQRLESVSAKMKGVCSEVASLQQFFMEFRGFLVTMRAERTHRAMMMLTRKPTTAMPEDLLPYQDCLTPYAFRMVQQQHADSLSIGSCSEVDENVDMFVFASATGTDMTRLGCCSCRIYTSRRLPCKHLLYVRRLRGVEFDETVFDSRWKRADYVSHCQLNLADGESVDVDLLDTKSDEEESSGTQKGQPSSVEQAEKYRKARHMTNQIASLCAKPGMTTYMSRLKLLQNLYSSWSKGIEVALVKLESVEATPSHTPTHTRKRGRPPKLDRLSPTEQPKQKQLKLLGHPKNVVKVSRQKMKPKRHQSALMDDGDDDGITSEALHNGDVKADDEDHEQVTTSDDVDAMLLAMAADNDTCLSADDNNDGTADDDLDLSASAEAEELDAADSNIADLTDCILGDDGSYVIVPENSGSLGEVVGSRLELRPLDAMNDIHMPSLPKPKRGRPPKCRGKMVPEKPRQTMKQEMTSSVGVAEVLEACHSLQSHSK